MEPMFLPAVENNEEARGGYKDLIETVRKAGGSSLRSGTCSRSNHDAQRVTSADIKPLHDAGWSDEAIYDAITVCALFNFYNRWVGASGVHPQSDEATRATGKRLAERGYIRS